jgi:hydrogenase-4 component E
VPPLVDILLVIVLLFNFLLLGQSRLRAVVRSVAIQGVVLGVLLVAAHDHHDLRTVGLGLAAAALKGIIIPGLLMRALVEANIRRDVEPLVSFVTSLLLGAVGTGLAILFAGTLPLVPDHAGTLIVPASLATVFTGFLILTTRRKAITQVVGYLTLENGIFLFGLTLLQAMPFMVEIGVLLDLLVGIFVMGIVIDHINREFSTVDTENLTNLRG